MSVFVYCLQMEEASNSTQPFPPKCSTTPSGRQCIIAGKTGQPFSEPSSKPDSQSVSLFLFCSLIDYDSSKLTCTESTEAIEQLKGSHVCVCVCVCVRFAWCTLPWPTTTSTSTIRSAGARCRKGRQYKRLHTVPGALRHATLKAATAGKSEYH